MKRACRNFLAVMIIFSCGMAHSGEKPKLPYIDEGACPFEGCVYRDWTAIEEGVAFKEPTNDSPVAFEIKKGESIKAITGFVATNKLGMAKIIKPIKLGFRQNGEDDKEQLNLKPGEIIYTLHYLGEGASLFWYHGLTYSDEIIGDPTKPPQPESEIQVISEPEYVWWVKINNKAGQVGWLKNPQNFEGADLFACL